MFTNLALRDSSLKNGYFKVTQLIAESDITFFSRKEGMEGGLDYVQALSFAINYIHIGNIILRNGVIQCEYNNNNSFHPYPLKTNFR